MSQIAVKRRVNINEVNKRLGKIFFKVTKHIKAVAKVKMIHALKIKKIVAQRYAAQLCDATMMTEVPEADYQKILTYSLQITPCP
jgi:glutamate formiminotransferase